MREYLEDLEQSGGTCNSYEQRRSTKNDPERFGTKGTIWKKPERFGKVRKGMGIYGKSGKVWNKWGQSGMPRNNPERHRKVKQSMVKSWKAGDNRAQWGATRNEQGQPGPMWENVE